MADDLAARVESVSHVGREVGLADLDDLDLVGDSVGVVDLVGRLRIVG